MLGVADLSDADWGNIALWGGVTILSFVAFIVAVVIMRRRFRDSDGSKLGVFNLEDLQKMRDRGDIDEAEYKALRTQAIATMMVDSNDRA